MSIYIIRSKEQSLHDIYIGSCKDMRKRRKQHKTDCYNENSLGYNSKLYKFIRANGGLDNFVMEEIDNCDVERLYQVEQYYIDTFNPSLNNYRAYRSEEQRKEYQKEYSSEHYENNKEYYKKRNKEWYKKNKDKINEKFTCECGSIYTRHHKARHFKTNKHKSFILNRTTI